MNILVTGANGQLGKTVQDLSKIYSNNNYYFTDIDTLDITEMSQVSSFVIDHNIDLIVNCAAYTNVDKAEENKEIAEKINTLACYNLGNVAYLHNCKLIHISTDYVFDGESNIPYCEYDSPMPSTVYGETKFRGEQYITKENPNSIIIRTAWLYSEYGNNFVKTMLKFKDSEKDLNVVFDQVGTPTYAGDLAKVIFEFINADEWHSGIYHFTNEGAISWYDFTKAIYEIVNIPKQINPITSNEYQYKTPRPHFSVLDKSKIKNTLGIEIPYWKDSLKVCIENMKLKNN